MSLGMNPNSLKNLRPFQKGVVHGARGRKKVDPALIGIKELTTDEVRRIVGKCCDMSKDDIETCLKDKRGTALELALMSALNKAIEEGDTARLDFLFNRTIGKVKEEVDHRIQVQSLSDADLALQLESELKILKGDTILIEANEVKSENETDSDKP
jgi:hypothetical protein